MKSVDACDMDRKSINILKKGTAYFSLNIGRLHFKDLLNFTCRMSLDRYLKTWTSDCIKLVYPYEKFKSIQQIRQTIVFPSIDEFKTLLKPQVDEEIYTNCKNEFERRINLPSGHEEKWTSFEDYLKFYNLSDV